MYNYRIIFISSFLILNCGNFFGNNAKLDKTIMALSGMALSKSDRFQGVSQASPGTTGGGIETFIPGTGVFIPENPSVQPDKSILRVKFHDDPVNIPSGSGLIQISAEVGYLENLFNELSIQPLDEVQFDIDYIEVLKAGENVSRKIVPTASQRSIKFISTKRFVSIIPELMIEYGFYSTFKIVFRNKAKGFYKQFYYPLAIKNPNMELLGGIDVRDKQVTNVNLWSKKEIELESQGLFVLPGANSFDSVINSRENLQLKNQIELTLNLEEKSRNFNNYPQEIYIGIISVVANTKEGQSYNLNDGAATFELLSLRNGEIGLIGSKEIDSMNIESVDITLSRSAKFKIDGEIIDTKFKNESQSKFRLPVNTRLKNGFQTELFFSIDPRKSFFPINDEWYFDPDIKSESTWQVSPDQLTAIYRKDSLLPNTIFSNSDLVLDGQVLNASYSVKTDPKFGKMIFTDFIFNIESVVKGKYDSSAIQLSVPGGVFNGVRMRAIGMPDFVTSERCLLFLRKKGETYQLYGGKYAKYKY